jgi:hypothetical protein
VASSRLCDPHGKAPINRVQGVWVRRIRRRAGNDLSTAADGPSAGRAIVNRLFGTVLRDRETSPGSDQVAYVFQRSLTLTAVTP